MQEIPAVPTPRLIWNAFRRGKNFRTGGYAMLNWLGHGVAGISELAFVSFVMKHLLYELLLLLLEQLLRETLSMAAFSPGRGLTVQRHGQSPDSPGLRYLCCDPCTGLGKRHMTAHETVACVSVRITLDW